MHGIGMLSPIKYWCINQGFISLQECDKIMKDANDQDLARVKLSEQMHRFGIK